MPPMEVQTLLRYPPIIHQHFLQLSQSSEEGAPLYLSQSFQHVTYSSLNSKVLFI